MCASLLNFAKKGASDALDFTFPQRCVFCDKLGDLLCEACQEKLFWIDQSLACPVCGAPYGWLTCTECKGDWELQGCTSAFIFGDVSARLVTVYKDEHERRLAPLLAEAIVAALKSVPRDIRQDLDAVTFVPATPQAFRRRGFDHMERVAKHVGQLLSLPVVDALLRIDAEDQRDLSREERRLNTRGTYSVVEDVSGLRLLLIDDVITTGASMREATRALLASGAHLVRGASVARTW